MQHGYVTVTVTVLQTTYADLSEVLLEPQFSFFMIRELQRQFAELVRLLQSDSICRHDNLESLIIRLFGSS